GADEHLETAREIADKSITLVKNSNEVLPLENSEQVFITGPALANPDAMADQLESRGITATSLATATSPTAAEISEAVSQSANADKIIITTYTANTNPAQQDLAQAL